MEPTAPPRMSTEQAAPSGKWKTVQPVGPSRYSATPTSRPGKSNVSRGGSQALWGARSAVSLVNTSGFSGISALYLIKNRHYHHSDRPDLTSAELIDR